MSALSNSACLYTMSSDIIGGDIIGGDIIGGDIIIWGHYYLGTAFVYGF